MDAVARLEEILKQTKPSILVHEEAMEILNENKNLASHNFPWEPFNYPVVALSNDAGFPLHWFVRTNATCNIVAAVYRMFPPAFEWGNHACFKIACLEGADDTAIFFFNTNPRCVYSATKFRDFELPRPFYFCLITDLTPLKTRTKLDILQSGVCARWELIHEALANIASVDPDVLEWLLFVDTFPREERFLKIDDKIVPNVSRFFSEKRLLRGEAATNVITLLARLTRIDIKLTGSTLAAAFYFHCLSQGLGDLRELCLSDVPSNFFAEHECSHTHALSKMLESLPALRKLALGDITRYYSRHLFRSIGEAMPKLKALRALHCTSSVDLEIAFTSALEKCGNLDELVLSDVRVFGPPSVDPLLTVLASLQKLQLLTLQLYRVDDPSLRGSTKFAVKKETMHRLLGIKSLKKLTLLGVRATLDGRIQEILSDKSCKLKEISWPDHLSHQDVENLKTVLETNTTLSSFAYRDDIGYPLQLEKQVYGFLGKTGCYLRLNNRGRGKLRNEEMPLHEFVNKLVGMSCRDDRFEWLRMQPTLWILPGKN